MQEYASDKEIEAKSLLQANRFDEAIALFQTIVRESRDDNYRCHSLCLLGKALAESGRIEVGRQTIESAVSTATDLLPLLNLARFEVLYGHPTDAFVICERIRASLKAKDISQAHRPYFDYVSRSIDELYSCLENDN